MKIRMLLISLLIAALPAAAFAGTTATNTINYTTSTRSIYDTSNEAVNQRVDTFSTQLIGRMQGGSTLYDQTFNAAFADPQVQAAIVTAQGVLTGSGATSFQQNLLSTNTSLVGSVASASDPVVTGTDVSAATTAYIGPQTIMVGENQSQAFTLLPGQVDYDTLITSTIHQTITTTTTDTYLTTEVYEVIGITGTSVTCTYALSSGADSFGSSSTPGSVTVTPSDGACSWTAASNDSWITVTAGSAGTGAGSVSYSITANTAETSRTGTITIAGQTFTVTQTGAPPSCTYTLSPSAYSFASSNATGSVTVTPSSSNCSWTAASNASWITVTAGSAGTGPGSVFYSVAANTTVSSRTGTITIAGQTFTVIQSGTETSFDTVQKAYIGYYQRPADPAGLIWWAGYLASHGGSLSAIIEAFANSAESQTLYGTIDSSKIAGVINAIYLALFNRNADTAGRDWYVAGFNSGSFTAATIMLNVLYGAQNDDIVTLNNKLITANRFTKTIDPELDSSNFLVTYQGNADAVAARYFLSLVTSATSTVPTQSDITEYIKSYIANTGDAILTP